MLERVRGRCGGELLDNWSTDALRLDIVGVWWSEYKARRASRSRPVTTQCHSESHVQLLVDIYPHLPQYLRTMYLDWTSTDWDSYCGLRFFDISNILTDEHISTSCLYMLMGRNTV